MEEDKNNKTIKISTPIGKYNYDVLNSIGGALELRIADGQDNPGVMRGRFWLPLWSLHEVDGYFKVLSKFKRSLRQEVCLGEN